MKKSIVIMQIGVFLGLLAETYLNAALVVMMQAFGVSADTVQWLTSLYMLTMGLCVPISAFLIKRTTLKELYVGTLSIFSVGTFLCAATHSFSLLLVGRLIQAVGASVMLPLMMHSIMVAYEPKERGSAMGKAMLVILFAPAIGPTFGALVMQLLSWRWIFLSTLIPLVGAFIWALRSMEGGKEREAIETDILSIVLSIIGFGCFVYGVQQVLSQKGSLSISLIIAAVGIVALVFFAFRQRKLPVPMLDLSILRKRTYGLGVLLITFTHMAMFASFVLLPMFLVTIVGLTPFQAGLAMLPGGIVGALVPRFVGRLYDRIGVRKIVMSGSALLVVAHTLVSLYTPETQVWVVVLNYMVLMGGFGSILTPTQTHSLNQLNRNELSSGTAIVNTMMFIGSSMGASFFVGIMTSQSARLAQCGALNPFLGGIHHAYKITGLFALLLFGISYLLKE